MILLVGLGNPGNKYAQTKHNVGWLWLDQLAAQMRFAGWQEKSKFQANILKDTWQGQTILFVKPLTYMNESGRAVRAVVDYYKLDLRTDTVMVGFDDLDIELGSYKQQWAKGPRDHNGLNSIYQHLGSEAFWHVRIGIDGRAGQRTIPSRDYVLMPFSSTEQPQLEQVLVEVVADSIRCINTSN